MKRFNLLKTFLIMSFFSYTLINPILSCSILPDYVFPTIEEQTEKASAIVRGIVKKVKNPKIGFKASVILTQTEFIKGCGPKRVIISNFNAGSFCGAGIPKVGDEIMVFVCPKKKNQKKKIRRWNVNQITAGAGWIYVKDKMDDVNWVQDKIIEEYEELGLCQSQGKCLTRIDD